MIRESRFGIHDISFMELDPTTKLPRFNMPFELGLFLAAKSFGTAQQRRKVALILDSGDFRYRQALSDISGQDIATHSGSAEKAIHEVRTRQLPSASKKYKLDADKLTYADLCRAMESWLKDNT